MNITIKKIIYYALHGIIIYFAIISILSGVFELRIELDGIDYSLMQRIPYGYFFGTGAQDINHGRMGIEFNINEGLNFFSIGLFYVALVLALGTIKKSKYSDKLSMTAGFLFLGSLFLLFVTLMTTEVFGEYIEYNEQIIVNAGTSGVIVLGCISIIKSFFVPAYETKTKKKKDEKKMEKKAKQPEKEKQSRKVFCQSCGAELQNSNDPFCSKCGAPLPE